jgi:two-component system sensor histidine kinase BaeS
VPAGLSATFDPDRITQVLGNLLDNALRHAGPVLIEVGAEAEAQGVKLWVRDYGPGLPQATLERALERFYRGDLSRARPDTPEGAPGDSSGSGLGLAIARALTEAHGGQLEAANHPEGGALFVLRLPDLRRESGVRL